jgi:hypothetical protein
MTRKEIVDEVIRKYMPKYWWQKRYDEASVEEKAKMLVEKIMEPLRKGLEMGHALG